MIGAFARRLSTWARVGAVLIVAIGAVGLVVAVLVWRFGILIPTAADAERTAPRARGEAPETIADQRLKRAIEAFRRVDEPDVPRSTLLTDLAEIEDSWPETLAGVRAGQMRVAAMLEESGCRGCQRARDEILAGFVQRAAEQPSLYFAEGVSYASSCIMARAVSYLRQAEDDVGAWRLCRDVRWVSGHPSVMKEACDEVWGSLGFLSKLWQAMDTPPARYEPYAFNASLEDVGIVLRNLKYRFNPYSGKNLRQLALALYRRAASNLAGVLQGELIALDISNASQLEGELAGLRGNGFPGVRFPDWPAPVR
ncbi:MAG: hypothetical protein WAK53_05405 [Chromatiaceae bacterium]